MLRVSRSDSTKDKKIFYFNKIRIRRFEMFRQKTGLIMAILLLVGLFITGVADAAPDMSQWVGKWFSYKVTMKGIAVALDGSSVQKGGEKESGYLKITEWNQPGEYFQIDTYFLDDGQWQMDSLTFQFMAGNDLTFLFVSNDADEVVIAALVKGKLKDGVLRSATIKSCGGIIVESEDDEVHAGNVSLSAKMIPETKVPDAIK
ncbi:hypothetical protein PITCH_A140017 [uncultured Desulfobacterium sp.]|uniref:Uncharacterized protein n=1 Tax=uncultured Desulfobacterium sp. TaxID=201089 RepID=A0A445MST7_9BACT|nr:hypothetical protein PITCH_A140017 [uncultured Desulfobacterium sp.]